MDSEHQPEPTPMAEAPPAPASAPHPLKSNLDAFAERIETLGETLRLSMMTLEAANKDAHKRFRHFLDTSCVASAESPNTFEIPPEHFGQFLKHHKRVKKGDIGFTAVPRSHVVALVSEFDAFMGSLLKTLFTLKPDALQGSSKPFTFADLTEIGSIDEAREYLIEREVESLLRDSHADQFKALETRFAVTLTKDLAVWPAFIELTERRNLFVHNRGIVTRHYLAKCKAHDYDCGTAARGDVLEAPASYFRMAHNIVYELAVKLTHVFWRRLDKATIDQADAHFSNVIYDLVRQGHYALAQPLADFGVNALKPPVMTEYSRRSLVVNRAQAYIWDGKKAEGLSMLDKEDWTAARDEFLVCVHALRGEFDAAVRVMRTIGASGRPGKDGYREWPVFQELRKHESFQRAFHEIFGESYATVTLEPPLADTDSTNHDPKVH